MLSDWHVGSGAGRPGDIDRLIQRDSDGLPYIPAKTLTGIWRDACELVALGLDEGQQLSSQPSWQKWVNFLFGDQPTLAEAAIEPAPRPAALSVRSAHLPSSLRKCLRCQPTDLTGNLDDAEKAKLQGRLALKAALTFTKPGISIDEMGCAKKDFLRIEELARSKATLEAECCLNLAALTTDTEKRTAYALLVAGTQLLERLGGKRRRGMGKCELTIDAEPLLWIDWIEKNLNPPLVPDYQLDNGRTSNSASPSAQPSTIATEWTKIPLKITARSPLVISARTIGNVVETLDYIPGTHLLRLVIRCLSGLGVDLSNAIAEGNLLVTNATIEVDQQPGRPVPLALFRPKLGGGFDQQSGKVGVYNRFKESEESGSIQLKGYRQGYIGPTSTDIPTYETVKTIVGTHNTIKDEQQRPTSDVGGVYSYQAIASGTVLRAELRLHPSCAATLASKQSDWSKQLNTKGQIGQSKKDDYGAIELEVVLHPEFKPPTGISENLTELTVWLLSDVLLRDSRLRPTTSIADFATELSKKLKPEGQGLKLTLKQTESELLTLMARQHRVDSWQVRWGLPRPSLVGLAAGTCVVFLVEGTIDPQAIAHLETSGIGERRAEGYGQICFNDPLLTSEIRSWPVASKSTKPMQSNQATLLTSQDAAFSYAQVIEIAAWRDAIQRATLAISNTEEARAKKIGLRTYEENGQTKSRPSLSQLGALRSAIMQLPKGSQPDSSVALQWLENFQKKQKEKGKPDCLSCLSQLLKNKAIVWQYLEEALKQQNSPTFTSLILTEEGEERLKQKLWTEAVQTLVDDCLRAHKRDLEPNQQPKPEGGTTDGASN